MKIYQKILDFIPNKTIENPKILNTIGGFVGRPAENRAIMGITAIATQPYIDEHNKQVDKKTARASKNRTIGKIVAGTSVGCVVRKLTYDMVDKCTDIDLGVEKVSNFFTPRAIVDCNQEMLKNKMRNYKTALATILSLGAMLLTNFLIDMPLTTIISNHLNKKDTKKAEHTEKSKNGGIANNTTKNTTKTTNTTTNNPETTNEKNSSGVSRASLIGMTISAGIGLGLLAYGKFTHGKKDLPSKEKLVKIPALVKTMTDRIFNNYSNNVAGMLIHTAIIGWVASSAAQLIGIATNKKYTQEQKSFMIPQEIADAAINIGSFFVITSSIKRLALKLVSTGKIIPQAVHNRIVAHGDELKIGTHDFDLKDVKYFEEIEKPYKSFLNFAGSTAAVVGGVISSNIVTPIIRNHFASSSLGQLITNRANSQTATPQATTKTATPVNTPIPTAKPLNQQAQPANVYHAPVNNNSPFADFKNKITTTQKE